MTGRCVLPYEYWIWACSCGTKNNVLFVFVLLLNIRIEKKKQSMLACFDLLGGKKFARLLSKWNRIWIFPWTKKQQTRQSTTVKCLTMRVNPSFLPCLGYPSVISWSSKTLYFWWWITAKSNQRANLLSVKVLIDSVECIERRGLLHSTVSLRLLCALDTNGGSRVERLWRRTARACKDVRITTKLFTTPSILLRRSWTKLAAVRQDYWLGFDISRLLVGVNGLLINIEDQRRILLSSPIIAPFLAYCRAIVKIFWPPVCSRNCRKERKISEERTFFCALCVDTRGVGTDGEYILPRWCVCTYT